MEREAMEAMAGPAGACINAPAAACGRSSSELALVAMALPR